MAEAEPVAVAVEPAPPPPRLVERLRLAPLTFLFVAINVAVFFIAERYGKTTEPATLLRFGACERYHVWVGEPWRLATSMFLHIGFLHLAWNAYGGIGWSMRVERALGSARFLVLYLASGLAAGAASVVGHEAVAAGSSGALFGVIGADLAIRRRDFPGWREFFSDKAVRSILTNMVIWTLIGLTAIAMDNFAHLGGLLAGLTITAAMLVPRASGTRRIAGAAVVVGLAVLVTAAVRPGWRPAPKDREALTGWATRHAFGAPAFRSPRLAAAFGARACDLGDKQGCAALASTLLDEVGDAAAQQRGVSLLKDACRTEGGALACAALAIAPPAIVGNDRVELIAAYDRYCASGELAACGMLGFIRAQTAEAVEVRSEGARAVRSACAAKNDLSCFLADSLPP